MAISKKDQRRLAEQAEYLENDAPAPIGDPSRIRRGAESAAFGKQMLLDALGSENAIEDEIRRGRPRLGVTGKAGTSSPVIRARIDEDRSARLDAIAQRTNKDRSALLREAVDLVLGAYEIAPQKDGQMPIGLMELLRIQTEVAGSLEKLTAQLDADTKPIGSRI